ncbi:DUF120 domain-containing protein [Falsochrobactrum ovis]|uniref:Uncharacterized protein DUF120 n=1 Tax=Falsochrobactrum ovis TaxID=1293442 RepID=A0A364JWP2_9HYPH|nr:DUF120 domain-containing protein [Falsochrobactrum ovis]RAK31049.1 uncharacterized protein DUF120 [Falsochrobactrum ovis]
MALNRAALNIIFGNKNGQLLGPARFLLFLNIEQANYCIWLESTENHCREAMIKIHGIVESGLGRHSELKIPGSEVLFPVPHDWPVEFYPGSLNVRLIDPPAPFNTRKGVKVLDKNTIAPDVVIARDLIGNNSLVRKRFKPRRGLGQAWRCVIKTRKNEANAWIFRRVGSHMHEHLEIIASEKLRPRLGLADGDQIEVYISATQSRK